MDDRVKKYIVCGHYGATNLGDEAIGMGLIEAIKSANQEHEITVMSYDKNRAETFYKKYLPKFDIKTAYLVPLGVRSLFRGIFKGELKNTKNEIKSCDRFILGGGGLFTDERLYAVFLWGLQAFVALMYKKPLYLIGHSVGPLNTRIGKWVVKKIFSRAEFISVRDSESKKVLQKLGIEKEIHVLCDMAMLMNFDEKLLNKKIEQNGSEKYFILTFRDWDEKLDKLNKKIEQEIGRLMSECNLRPVLIPFQLIKENDQEIMNKKIVQNGDLKKIVVQGYHDNVFEILEQIKGAEFVIGVRLHSLVFSSLMGTPFVGISYSKKVENFMSELELKDFCLKGDQFEEDLLGKKIDRMIEGSEDIRKILTKKIPLMKEEAKNTLKKVLK
jgi:polysaccharide pyruvyl transferase CsaB